MLTFVLPVRAESDPTHPDLDYSAGLTLLTVRPQLLLASLHQLVIMLGLRLTTLLDDDDEEDELEVEAFARTFSAPASRPTLDTAGKVSRAVEEELRVIREVMEKTKALESKVAYQVKKLVALASTASSSTQTKGESSGNKNEEDEEEEQDQLSYKPNVGAILSSKSAGKARDVDQDDEDRDDARAKRRIKNSRRSLTPSDEDEDEQARDGIYRPPRLGAIPYNEGRKGESRPWSKTPTAEVDRSPFSPCDRFETCGSTSTGIAIRVRRLAHQCAWSRVYLGSFGSSRRGERQSAVQLDVCQANGRVATHDRV